MTDFEKFKSFMLEKFGFTHCDIGLTADGHPWVSISDGETYTFFCFRKEDDSFDECGSRRYSDHAKIDTPARMLGLRDDFKEWMEEEG